MRGVAPDLVGKRFGRLVVLERAGNIWASNAAGWLCQCDCGKRTITGSRNLISGNTKGCGCGSKVARNAVPPPPVPGAAWIALTKGKFALIDEADAERASKHSWRAAKAGDDLWYASGHIDGRGIALHRWLLSAPPGSCVDHANGNTLDNRRANLRLCSHAENQRNMHKHRDAVYSKYKGVTFDKGRGRWRAGISAGQWRSLGTFTSELDAALAYDAAARKLHGAFARVNFPEPQEVGAL